MSCEQSPNFEPTECDDAKSKEGGASERENQNGSAAENDNHNNELASVEHHARSWARAATILVLEELWVLVLLVGSSVVFVWILGFIPDDKPQVYWLGKIGGWLWCSVFGAVWFNHAIGLLLYQLTGKKIPLPLSDVFWALWGLLRFILLGGLRVLVMCLRIARRVARSGPPVVAF